MQIKYLFRWKLGWLRRLYRNEYGQMGEVTQFDDIQL